MLAHPRQRDVRFSQLFTAVLALSNSFIVLTHDIVVLTNSVIVLANNILLTDSVIVLTNGNVLTRSVIVLTNRMSRTQNSDSQRMLAHQQGGVSSIFFSVSSSRLF